MNGINTYRIRLMIAAGIMTVGFLILFFKLYQEQIYSSERYQRRISRQSVRRVRLPGLRGRIFTSDYLLLADSAPSYNLVFYLQEMRRKSRRRTIENIRKAAAFMAQGLERPDTLTEEKIRRHIRVTPGLPLVIYENLSDIELARAYQLMPQISGLGIEVEAVRNYPQGSLASLVVGFTRTESPQEALDRNDYSYYQSDFEGKSGVERAFDQIAGNLSVPGLAGTPGYELMQVDHLGYACTYQLEHEKPLAGSNIVLNLDSRAQILGEKLMQGKRGALVLLNADTGAVLAMVSAPQFDISRTTPVWARGYYRELLHDPNLPMFNRAIYGSYMPGSIVKPLAALAALKENFDPEAKVDCDGRTIVQGTRISCANRFGHGPLNMIQAIEKSCNDYFIEMGLALGEKKLSEMYQAAGIGSTSGLEIGGVRGLNPAEKINSSKFKWRKQNTALISIGQDQIKVSPLQAARFTAALANGGKLMETQLLKEVYDDKGKLLFRNQPRMTTQWDLPEGALTTVQQGMFEVVNSPHGSGKSAQSDMLTIYGKTGTAEVDTRQGRINNTWFTCFTAKNNTRYALTILVEEGRSGGRNCAPIAKEFLEKYLLENL